VRLDGPFGRVIHGMTAPFSLFLDFNLPNATTWFYFSLLLAVGFFFKFGRLLSVRNWDIITLFLLVPGLLVVQGVRPEAVPDNPVPMAAGLVGATGPSPAGLLGGVAVMLQRSSTVQEAAGWLWFGYLWLLAGSAYFFCRCLLDLALVQRPALGPNLNFGGLAWLAGALMICLIVVALRQVERQAQPIGPELISLALARDWLGSTPWATGLVAIACHLAVVAGLIVVGWRVYQDAAAGMAAATFYLMLPYTGLYVGQVQHVLPTVLLVWAIAAYRWPMLLGTILGVATATTYFPLLTMPLWLSFYRGRGAGRFLFAYTLSTGLCLAGLWWVLSQRGDLQSILRETLAQTAWQPWKVPTTEGFWTGIHWAYRIPVFLGYFAFVVGTLFWPVPKNLAHAIALTTAVVIGIQFWYADRGGVYVLWYLPMLLLLVFRPNLHDRLAPPISAETDWLGRLARAVRRGMRWVLRMPEPAPARTP
jgi:hypothetical protein